ncbi:MAG TPA: hypothetical protein VNS32_22770 [Flavisolibacter sp.]|nr:hypothetical protein [Flavisolibacter sp.]
MEKGYKVLMAFNLEELENKVNAYLKQNWVLIGGISVTTTEDPNFSREYFQAVFLNA